MALNVSGAAVAEPSGVAGGEHPLESSALIAATQSFFDRVETVEVKRTETPVIGWSLKAVRANVAVPDDVAVLTRMGPVRNLTGYQVTWYPMDRLTGTIDFMGTWDGNRNLVCGYLSWDLTDADNPVLESVSANFVSLDTLAQADAVEVHRLLFGANCAFGAIDSNYAFFDVAG